MPRSEGSTARWGGRAPDGSRTTPPTDEPVWPQRRASSGGCSEDMGDRNMGGADGWMTGKEIPRLCCGDPLYSAEKC